MTIDDHKMACRQFNFYHVTFTIDKRVIYRSKEPIQASDACKAVELTIADKLFQYDDWMVSHRIEAIVAPVGSILQVLVSFKLSERWLTMPRFNRGIDNVS